MSDLNQCQFIGRLGDNPTMRQTQNGEPMPPHNTREQTKAITPPPSVADDDMPF